MKHLGKLLQEHIETNKLIKKQVANRVGITPAYLSEIFKRSSIDCLLYERLCIEIGMNPSVAFDGPEGDYIYANNNHASTIIGNATVSIGENQALRELVAEKERVIQLLMKSVDNSQRYNNGTNTEIN